MDSPSRRVEDLIPDVYDDLRKAAAIFFRRQSPGFTLQPTELVNEACIHLIRHARGHWRDARHFRAIATKKIWQIVVDHLRSRQSLKRGGTGPDHARRQRLCLDEVGVEWNDSTADLLDLAAALDALAVECRRKHRIVMLHWFGGMPYDDIADLLGVSTSTVERDFRYALAWLHRAMQGADAHAN